MPMFSISGRTAASLGD